ncbi:response regulator transcription factor [Pedobacter montanisoli]|uniref:Response regulator transcription factor n=1 Tax=Pedobacter montanisoli TaxID=2923277 RepID=A0ABS9ZY85_9SPHI|nr:response regulator transcription factor [Pedobacter montanisoli]MCJ0743254.1 response regulator transcription factor [Pedobacter montanisoli]
MMSKIHILLIEDEPALARVISDSLAQQNYNVTIATDGKKAYNTFLNGYFDLLILDVMLPHTDGFTLAQQIRLINKQTPLLFLTAKTETKDVIKGYESGGNDYLRKPFSLDELFLRVAELLNRHKNVPDKMPEQINIGKYLFKYEKQELWYDQELIRLSNRETELLFLLYKHKNAITERKTALTLIWGDDSFFNTRTMDVFITRLRKHLQKDKSIEILNIRGMGYKLVC